jgi:DNA-binding response OmpR family regulator
MASPYAPLPRQVGILVLEADPKNSDVLKQILDSEGWRVRVVQDIALLHAELKTTEYSLLIANVELIGVESPTFHVLRELATVSAEDGGRIRTLFVIPEMGGSQFIGHLEIAHLPYVTQPFHLHDFLEKVSDLLVEVKAIEAPLRMTRYEFGEARKNKKKKENNRTTSMFASRDSYSYSEEEIAEYEKAEAESSAMRRTKPRTNLGNPRS